MHCSHPECIYHKKTNVGLACDITNPPKAQIRANGSSEGALLAWLNATVGTQWTFLCVMLCFTHL